MIENMSYGTKPNKTLGQHFLSNTAVLKSIVEAVQIAPRDMVLEVGPGTGTLTDELLAAGARVIAVEKDGTLVAKLKEKYRDNKNIEIVEEDILNFDPIPYTLTPKTYKLVGNIPYYLTSHLIRTIFETWPMPALMVLMVQKEVAKRITATPPNMNMLAVLAQYYSAPSIVRIVKRGNFSPMPKVDSAIVRFVPHHETRIMKHETFFEIASKGFRHPRKKLSNNLPQEVLEKGGIDPNRRAETLTIEEWITLAQKTDILGG